MYAAQDEAAKVALRLLAEASQEFAEATGDYQRLLAVVARRVGEVVGDLCSIRALSEDGTELEVGAAYHRDPEVRAWAHQLLSTHAQGAGEGAMGRVALSGQRLFMPKLSAVDFAASTSPHYRQFLEQLDVGSLIAVPMRCRGKVIGVVAVLRSGSERPYGEQDVQLVQSIADHAALAVANARSYAAERVARAAAVHANEALQRSASAHRLLFESSPVPLLVFDIGTLEVLAVNEAASRHFGYSRDEMLSLHLAQLLQPAARPGLSERVSSLGVEPGQGLARYMRKDGTHFLAEYSSRTFEFDNRIARITQIADVTARQEAEAMRALLAAIVQSSNDAIISQRLDGVVTSWNAGAERLFGYSSAEAIGKPASVFIPDDRLTEDRVLHARVAAGERVAHHETVRRRKDGSLVTVSISLAPVLDTTGQVVGASKTCRDLSAEREAEEALKSAGEQLRQAQKMEAVGRLAGGIAHDFNNLLSVILSYSDLALDALGPSARVRGDVTEIRKAAERAAELTQQLLVFSRKQVVALKVLDLNEVIASLDSFVRRIVGEDVDLVSSPFPGLGRVLADRSNVEQAIMNLVVNARDAMPTGGKLTIETGNVYLDDEHARKHPGSTSGPHVMLAVSDSGTGMDRATQDRIFEPFFTTKATGKGTGLGLSTVFGIAQQSGGSVWVYSEPGKGTTFKLYFPAVEAATELSDPAVTVSTVRGTETILLVEDQEQVRKVAHGILARSGYRVVVAEHEADALVACVTHSGPIDLLLTDVVMPHMSGAELAKRITLLRPSTRVLYMSGYTDDSVVRHGILESELAFLQKPFTPESLTRKVREVLATPRAHEPPSIGGTLGAAVLGES